MYNWNLPPQKKNIYQYHSLLSVLCLFSSFIFPCISLFNAFLLQYIPESKSNWLPIYPFTCADQYVFHLKSFICEDYARKAKNLCEEYFCQNDSWYISKSTLYHNLINIKKLANEICNPWSWKLANYLWIFK